MKSNLMSTTVLLLLSCGGHHEKPATTPAPQSADRPVAGLLTLAVMSGDGARVNRLLEMGADINEMVGTEPITPLLVAVAVGNEVLAVSLILRGAAAGSRYRGYSVADFSIHLGLTQVLNTLSIREPL